MLEMLKGVIWDSLSDSIKLLPFLFFTYLIMEYLEHMAGDKMQAAIRKSGKGGPIFGSILGAFPQCGFSAAASNLYAGRIITMGTLLSVYLSTSDEMLPILISEKAGVGLILRILGTKIVIGMAAGFAVDIIMNKILKKKNEKLRIEHLCEQHNCHCENGILRSTLHHTLEIFIYILLISFVLNFLVAAVGKELLISIMSGRPVIGAVIAGVIGLIPNCAASVVITQLYLEGFLSTGAMMAGLLVGAGVGILVLLRVNDNTKENVRVIALLYGIGVIAGILMELLGISF